MSMPRLTDPRVLEQILAQEKTSPVRGLGQNFLICDEPVDAILTAMDSEIPLVTELGPGAGAVTQGLLANNFIVRAIEKDSHLVNVLERHMSKKLRSNLTIIHGDLREETWEHEQPWQLVGNIPYNLSGLIFRRLTQLNNTPRQAILMVQQEVGANMAAHPPHMTLLSLIMQLWGEVHLLLTIPADCYLPQPKVHSAVMLLIPHEDMRPLAEREQVIKTAKRFFTHRRKQIGGVMKKQLHLSDEKIESVLTAASINKAQRPQELTVEQWCVLTQQIA